MDVLKTWSLWQKSIAVTALAVAVLWLAWLVPAYSWTVSNQLALEELHLSHVALDRTAALADPSWSLAQCRQHVEELRQANGWIRADFLRPAGTPGAEAAAPDSTLRRAAESGRSITARGDDGAYRFYLPGLPAPGGRPALFVELPASRLRDRALPVLAESGLLLLVGLLFAAGLLLALFRRGVLLPFRQIAHRIKRSTDTLDCTALLEYPNDDEIAQVVEAYNAYLAMVGFFVREIRDTAARIRATCKEIDRLSVSVDGAAKTAAQAIDEVSRSFASLTQTLAISQANAREVASISTSASRSANSGKAAVIKTILAIKKIEQRSKAVSEIIEIIDEVADQTNLLALNAAIESARAGEQGKGFAVVAEEVRKLALRSSEAASQVDSLLCAISENVGNTVALADDAGDKLVAIVGGIQKTANLNREISTSIGEHTERSRCTMDDLARLNEITRNHAAQSGEARAVAVSLLEQAEKIGRLIEEFKA